MQVIPQAKWIEFSHEVIFHGRQICIARKPRCVDCTLERLCNSADKTWIIALRFAVAVAG